MTYPWWTGYWSSAVYISQYKLVYSQSPTVRKHYVHFYSIYNPILFLIPLNVADIYVYYLELMVLDTLLWMKFIFKTILYYDYLSPCFRFKKSCGISCWHTDPNKPVISNLSVFFLERMIFPAWKSEQSWIQINKMDAWMILLQLNTTVFCKAIFAYHSENLMEYSNTLDFYIVS